MDNYTMTIIEAINSGKRFRRKNFPIDRWYIYEDQDAYMTIYKEKSCIGLNSPQKSDILANDWEIEPALIEPAVALDALRSFCEELKIRKFPYEWSAAYDKFIKKIGL